MLFVSAWERHVVQQGSKEPVVFLSLWMGLRCGPDTASTLSLQWSIGAISSNVGQRQELASSGSDGSLEAKRKGAMCCQLRRPKLGTIVSFFVCLFLGSE